MKEFSITIQQDELDINKALLQENLRNALLDITGPKELEDPYQTTPHHMCISGYAVIGSMLRTVFNVGYQVRSFFSEDRKHVDGKHYVAMLHSSENGKAVLRIKVIRPRPVKRVMYPVIPVLCTMPVRAGMNMPTADTIGETLCELYNIFQGPRRVTLKDVLSPIPAKDFIDLANRKDIVVFNDIPETYLIAMSKTFKFVQPYLDQLVLGKMAPHIRFSTRPDNTAHINEIILEFNTLNADDDSTVFVCIRLVDYGLLSLVNGPFK